MENILRRYYAIGVFAAIFAGAFLGVFTRPASALTLAEARKEALRVNISMKIFRAKAFEARSLSKGSYSDLFAKFFAKASVGHVEPAPHVNLKQGEFGASPIIGPLPVDDRAAFNGKQDTYAISVQAQQPIFAGGRLYYSYLGSMARSDYSKWEEQQSVEDVLMQVEQSYIGLLQAQEISRVAKLHVKTIEAHLADMLVQYKNGRIALNEVLKVKVLVYKSYEDEIGAENDVKIVRGQLNMILNRPFEQVLETMPLEEVKPVGISLIEARGLAMSNRPSLKMARSSMKEAGLNRKVSEAGYFPELNFVSGYTHQTEQPTHENDEWQVGLNMQYTLWEWGGTHHRVEAARSRERQSRMEMSDVEASILADVSKALLRIREADMRLDVARQALEQAKENYRITKYGFDNGAKTSTEVLDAEELRTKINSELIQARYASYYTRTVFRYATGTIENMDILATGGNAGGVSSDE